MDGRFDTGIEEHDIGEVTLVARGIATAVVRNTSPVTIETVDSSSSIQDIEEQGGYQRNQNQGNFRQQQGGGYQGGYNDNMNDTQ